MIKNMQLRNLRNFEVTFKKQHRVNYLVMLFFMECSFLTTIGAKRADTLIYLFTGLLPCTALFDLFAALSKMPKYTIQYRTMS